MGCRPSKHATSKIRDAHARGANHCTCMYSPRKYNKKHKCNSNGTGSRRTSGGTQSGSHGHSSTGHRSKSHKSDDNEFPVFSTTTAVYRRSASKASKITLRLSSDGSTLEIEQCDYNIAKSNTLVKPTSRPWNSTPNLTKVGNKGSPMFQNIDLRPSASVWTNTSASRSTPGSTYPTGTWQAALLAERVKKNERQIDMEGHGVIKTDIRETILLNDDERYGDMKEASLVNEQVYAFNKCAPTFSVPGQGKSLSYQSSRSMVCPIAFHPELHSQFSDQHADSESIHYAVSSPNHNLNFYCLSQIGESYPNGAATEPKTQHRDKCTASLKKHESLRRSDFNDATDIGGIRSNKNDNITYNSYTNCNLTKLNQRYSIPRYDCFRIPDYSVYNQSTSSEFESSNQRHDDLSGNNESCNWLDGCQKASTTPRRRSHFEDPTWNEKLTDREKLVLNLSTRPHSVSNNSVEHTALVGRRDEHWHTNNNLISGQNGDQPFESAVLSSPVESDTVLTFVELGCPVSDHDSQFNPEMHSPLSFYSPLHFPTCTYHYNDISFETRQDRLQTESNDDNVNHNNSNIFENSCTFKLLALKDDGVSLNTSSGKDYKKQTISDACSAIRPQFLTRTKFITSPGSLIKKSDNNKLIIADSGTKKIDFDSCFENNQVRRKTETMTSLIQQDRLILETNNGKDFKSSAITPLTRINADTPEHSDRTVQIPDENSSVRRGNIGIERGNTGIERRAGIGKLQSRNIDENGNFNANEKHSSIGSEMIGNQTNACDGNKNVIKESNEEGLLNVLKNQKNFSAENERLKEIKDSLDVFYEDISNKCIDNDMYGPDRTHSLPLLCYNNSFGKRFQDLSLRENNSNNQETPAINSSGPASPLNPVREKVGNTEGTFNHHYDKIDTNNFHHVSQSPTRESKGISPSDIESTPTFYGTLEMKGDIDFWSDSGNFPAGVQTFIDFNYTMNRDRTCSQNQDVIIASSGSHITGHKISWKNYTNSCSRDSNELIDNTKPINNYSNLSTFVNVHRENNRNPEKSITSDKTAWQTNRDDVCFDGLLPDSTVMSVLRNPVPLGILQARIIGRNISSFANACFYFDHNDIPSFLSIPVTSTLKTTSNIMNSIRTEEININKNWTPFKSAKISEADSVASSISEPACNNNNDDSNELNLFTKSKLHSKYALSQARLTENMEKSLSSSISSLLPNDDKTISSAVPIVFPCQTLDSARLIEHVHSSTNESEFQPSIICSSTSSSNACLPDSDNSQIHLPEAFTSSSSTQSSTGEFTSQEDDGIMRPPCNSSILTIRPTMISSNEPYSLVNTQLSSSHSSDSLSCSLSIYSLANTLHSDTSHSDTGHIDTLHSDISHSDTARYDFPHSDSSHSDNLDINCSHHDTVQSDAQQSNDNSQSDAIQSSTHQCVLQPDSHLPTTHQSNCTRSNTPSSFPSSQSTHSPRSSPLSTISHHSSPSSQSTLSPHSSSPSSPSHQSFHDATESLQDEHLHSYSTPPESVSSLNNPSFVFPLSFYPSSPPPIDTHGVYDSGLSILAPSPSCRSTSTQNLESHQNQRIIDLDDSPSLNHDEIQRSFPSAPCDCSEDHLVKWDTTISGGTLRKFHITSPPRLRWQNGHSHNNRSILSDQENVFDSKCIEQAEGDEKTTSKRDDEETRNWTCESISETEHEKLIIEVQKGESSSINDEINVHACDQNSHFHTDELIMPSVPPRSFTRQLPASNITFDTERFNSKCIGYNDLQTDRYFHLYANDPSNNQEETVSPQDLGDDQNSKASFIYQYPPMVDHESNCNDSEIDREFQKFSYFQGDNDIRNSQQYAIFPRKVENYEFPNDNEKNTIAERLDDKTTDTSEAVQSVKCILEEKSSDNKSNEFIIDNVRCSEITECLPSGVEGMEESTVLLVEHDKNTRTNPDCLAGDSMKTRKLVSSSNEDLELLKRSCDNEYFPDVSNDCSLTQNNHSHEFVTERQTTTDDNRFCDDDFQDQRYQTKLIYPNERNSSCSGKLALDVDKQCGVITSTSRLSNQIDTEITKQISDENRRRVTMDANFTNLSTSTDISPIGQSRNDSIDPLSCTQVTSHEKFIGEKTERQKRKRKVQSLVQHFESVSMRGQAETQAQEKF